MGSLASVIGSGALGLGAALMSKKPAYSMPTAAHSAMAARKPATPASPTAPATGEDSSQTHNPQMEAAREKERQAALLRSQQAPEIFTSGLGAAGLAALDKKSLLGG